MKQKLLLALFVLFASVGAMRAAGGSDIKITAPYNSGEIKVTFSVNSGGLGVAPTITGATNTSVATWNETTNSYVATLPNNGTLSPDVTWVITRATDSKYTNISIENASKMIPTIEIDEDVVTKVSIGSMSLKTLTVTNAAGLAELSFSNNLVNVNNLDLSRASSLKKLVCDNNQLTGTLTVASSLTDYSCSGNQLVSITGINAGTIKTQNFGTQTLTYTQAEVAKLPIANQWFDLAKIVKSNDGGVSLTMFTDASKMKYGTIRKLQSNGAYSTAAVKQNSIKDTEYRFQTSSAYESGSYQVEISTTETGKTNWKYLVNFIVAPAQYTLATSVNPAGKGTIVPTMETSVKVKGSDGNDINLTRTVDGSPVYYQGDIISFTAEPTGAYSFQKYDDLLGFSKPEAGQKVAQMEVKGLTPSDDPNSQTLKATAYFLSNTCKINKTSVAEGGTYEITYKDGTPIINNTVNIGAAIKISAHPLAEYEVASITVGDNVYTVGGTTYAIVDNEAIATISKETTIAVLFKKKGNADISTIVYFPEYTKVTVANVVWDGTNGKESGVAQDITSRSITVKVEAKTNTDAIKVKSIRLNDVPATAITNNSAIFTIKESVKEAVIYVDAVKLEKPEIIPAKITQTVTYDGDVKDFKYTTTPIGLSYIIYYAKKNGASYEAALSTAPKLQGEYKVTYKRNEDDKYAKHEGPATGTTYTLIIAKADLVLTSPTITTKVADGVMSYVLQGGSASFKGQNIAGEFKLLNNTGTIVDNWYIPSNKQAASHLVNIQFVPKSTTDKNNFTDAKTSVAVKIGTSTVKEYIVKGVLKEGITVDIFNGNTKITNGGKVPAGSEVRLVFNVPANVKIDKVLNNTSAQENFNYSENTKTCTITAIDKDIDFRLTTSAVSDSRKNFTINVKKQYEVVYNGTVRLYAPATLGDYIEVKAGASAATNPVFVYTYKQDGKDVVSPVDAGTYSVNAVVTPSTTDEGAYKPTTVTTTMVIKRATPVINKAPEASKIGRGQMLSTSELTGGAASVPGKFEWADPTEKPQATGKFKVVFKPTDNKNYENVYSVTAEDNTNTSPTVTVSDKAIISLAAENGTITAKDASGRIYKSGDEVVSGVVLTFTATPAEGYELLTPIKVNGTSISSTYTATTTSITVTADFTMKPFAVTVNAPSKGLIMTLPASNRVKKGESYVITLAHLAADKPVVKDGSTVITGVSGKYTISNITTNKTITITLDTPTAIVVKSDATLSPQGKPMGTIVLTGLTDGKCFYGDKITAKATSVSGVQFSGWNGLTSTENPLTMTVTGTLTLKALYLGTPTGIADIEGTKVYGAEGYIYVSCEGQATVTVVTMDGRSQQVRIVGEARIETGAGIYGVILQQGTEVLKKKVVVR